MLIDYALSQTSVILRVKLRDSTVTTGAGLTGLTSASSGLKIATIADNEAATTSYTVAGSTIDTVTTLGTYAAPASGHCRFREVSSSDHPGVYELQFENSRFAVSNAKSLLVSISGASQLAQCDFVVPLRRLDPYDQVRAGLTALPNAVAAASGGLPTVGTGSGQISLSSGGVDLQTIKTQTITCSAGVTVNVNVGTTQPINFTGTSSSATVKSDLVNVAGSTLSTTTAQIGVNVVQAGAVTIYPKDGTLAAASSTTVTFPTTDSAGNAIPDDGRYARCAIYVVAGTGVGQLIRLTTSTGTARQYNVQSGSMPVTPSTNSDYVLVAPWEADVTLWRDSQPSTLQSGRVDSYLGATGAVTVTANTTQLAGQTVTAAAGVTFSTTVGTSTLTQSQVTGGAYSLQTDGSGYIKVSSGTGTGQISLTSGGVTITPGGTDVTIQKNVAFNNFMFPMVLSSDHLTPATGKTITATRSLDGGAFASCANSASEVSGGWYKINLSASDLNGDMVVLSFTATACDTTSIEFTTQP